MYLKIILYTIIVISSVIYIWYELLEKKINFKNYRLYISFIGMISAAIINYLTINKFIKILIITIILIIFYKFLFKKDIRKSIVTPIFSQIIIMISESIYAIILILLNFNINDTITSLTFNAISNIIISLMAVIIIKFKKTKLIYKKIVNITENISLTKLIIICMIGISLANVLAMSVYYKIEFQYLLIFNVFMTLFLFLIIIYSFKKENEYKKVFDKYNIAINSLNDYEEMMSNYRVANHENKNLLLTIRAMIINKEKEIPNYIDSIVKDKYDDNDNLLKKVNIIPSGGLRATIYSEILKIKKKNINYELIIGKRIKTVDIIEISKKDMIDICKIICVFIDNAIEEVVKLKKKNICINIYVEENYFNIKVSNNYETSIDINKIYNKGYTTKGKGHGYGLALVKQIIDNNEIFDNKIEMTKEIFSQILIIDLKKIEQSSNYR